MALNDPHNDLNAELIKLYTMQESLTGVKRANNSEIDTLKRQVNAQLSLIRRLIDERQTL